MSRDTASRQVTVSLSINAAPLTAKPLLSMEKGARMEMVAG